MLLYLAQEGRGIGLLNKLRAYELQEQGRDTVEANAELGFAPDLREYGIGSQILVDLGLSTIRILTNNPRKIQGLEGFGLTVTEQVPIETTPTEHNLAYLRAKRDKLGHRLHHQHLKLQEGMLPSEPPQGVRRSRRAASPIAGGARPVVRSDGSGALAAPAGARVVAGACARSRGAGRDRRVALPRRHRPAARRRRLRRAGRGRHRAGPGHALRRCRARSSCRWRRAGFATAAATPR